VLSQVVGLIVDLGLGTLAYRLAKQVSAALASLEVAVNGHVSKDTDFHADIERRVAALEDKIK